MAEKTESLLEFPCRFPLKVMCHNQHDLTEEIQTLIKSHIDETAANLSFNTRESKTGKYLSITALFTAESQTQLDNLYQALTEHDHVVMVL